MFDMLKRSLRLKKTVASCSKDENGELHLSFALPKSWEELTQSQFFYICKLISLGTEMDELKFWAFVRFTGLSVISKGKGGWNFKYMKKLFSNIYFFLSNEEIVSLCSNLDFLDNYPEIPINIEKFGNFIAIDKSFHGVSFKTYLELENHWQGYLKTKDNDMLVEISKRLYRNYNGIGLSKLDNVQAVAIVIWLSSVKAMFAEHWPYLFQKPSSDYDGYDEEVNMEDVMNAEIRGLTGGDVTKEKEVLSLDVWRALTELNEKARESFENKSKSNSKK